MNAIRALFVIVFIVLIASGSRASVILGPGTASCETWSADRQRNQTFSQLNQAWVLGYVTAYNIHKPVESSMTKPIDNRQIMLWIDNYCDANPDKTISDAAKALIEELTGRAQQ